MELPCCVWLTQYKVLCFFNSNKKNTDYNTNISSQSIVLFWKQKSLQWTGYYSAAIIEARINTKRQEHDKEQRNTVSILVCYVTWQLKRSLEYNLQNCSGQRPKAFQGLLQVVQKMDFLFAEIPVRLCVYWNQVLLRNSQPHSHTLKDKKNTHVNLICLNCLWLYS